MLNPWRDAPTPETDWLAGLLAADGCIGDRARISLSQSGDEGARRMEHARRIIGLDRPLTTHQPKVGALVHSLAFVSGEAADVLAERYGIGPRKSLTLRWPNLTDDRAAAFLRGYVEGDGHISVRPVNRARTPYLLVSYAGTAEFAEGAVAVTPGAARINRVGARKSIVEVRYNGRQGWLAGAWLFADDALPVSVKVETYRAHVGSHTPRWEQTAPRRAHVLELLASGKTLRATAAESGVSVSAICRWKKEHAS